METPSPQEAGEGRGVRPVSPDVPDAPTLPGEGGLPAPTRRRRGVAVAVLVLVVGGFAVISGGRPPVTPAEDDPSATITTLAVAARPLGAPPPPTTTTRSPPPSLAERVPGLTTTVHMVVQGSGDAPTASLRWDPASAQPNRPDRTGFLSGAASYDAAGSEVLWVTFRGVETLWIGRPPLALPLFVDVTGAMWHPTEPRRLAWVGRPPGGTEQRLYRLDLAPSSGAVVVNPLDGLVDVGPVPPDARLAAWGDWGFALTVPVPAELRTWKVVDPADASRRITEDLHVALILDGSGEAIRSTPGLVLAASAQGHLLIRATPEAYTAAVTAGNDPAALGFAGEVVSSWRGADYTPTVVVDADLQLTGTSFPPDGGITRHLFSPDGRFAVAVEWLREGRFSVTSVPLQPGGPGRVTSIEGAHWYIGPTADGRYLVVQDRDSGDLIFHDWDRGTSHRVPFAAGQVVALHAVADES